MDRWRDETIAWWGGERVRLAFAIAPLVCSVIVLLHMVISEPSLESFAQGVFAGVSMIPLSYIATLLFGVPVYRFLCSRRLTAFWIAPIAGFIAGAAAAVFFFVLVTIVLGIYSSFDKLASLGGLLLAACYFGAVYGAPIATVVWLIARPDRAAA